MTQPVQLTKAEMERLHHEAICIHETYPGDQFDDSCLDPIVAEIIAERLATQQPLTLLDTTIVGLPVPVLTWHPDSADDFQRIVAAFPHIAWEAKAVGSTQYVSGEHGPFSLTIFAPRRPATREEPTYANELLDGVRLVGHSHTVGEACTPEGCTGHPKWDEIRAEVKP